MRCYQCGQEIDEGARHCMYCGANQSAAPAPAAEAAPAYAAASAAPVYVPAPNAYVPPVDPRAAQSAPVVYARDPRPVLQLSTNRGLAKMFFLGLITLGIYNVVIFTKMATDLNIVASRYDGRRTMPYFAMVTLAPLTLGILPWVWNHNMCDRIGIELRRRNINYKFGASTFWLWNILGSLILVGPFIYTHKLMKAMNLLCEDYNRVG